MSSCAAVQFHSDASLEAVDRRRQNNSKNLQWADGRRSYLLRIVGNLNSNRYVCKVLQPEIVPLVQILSLVIFQQDNEPPYVAKIIRDFFSTQHMPFLWPAYQNKLPFEHVWDSVDRRLDQYQRPAALKDELLLRIQAIWNSLPQTDIQNLTP
ncbi:transposable element Tcb2 transposase [Trichonephila clavipes]|nr:transposable element Tcb2 transposase [Trichonephila clavipes]